MLMSTGTSVTPAIAFVDLATFSEIESYLYGGCLAVTYFVRSVKKANWFSFVPVTLRHVSGTANFGEEFSASVNRSGDYVLNVWLRVQVPQLRIAATAGTDMDTIGIRWTHNFMHNLVQNANITFNELTVQSFDSFWFDVNNYFSTDASKRVGYDTMIGEIDAMTGFVYPLNADGTLSGEVLGTGGYFNLPLPFWFASDSGVALPVAALPFNDIKINYTLRDWEQLLVVDPGAGSALTTRELILGAIETTTGVAPRLLSVETRAHYAVIHNDERVLMGKCARDIMIYQVQNLEGTFDALAISNDYDIRFSHSIIFLAWAARNTTIDGELSVYTVLNADNTVDPLDVNGFDPIAESTIIYENSQRVHAGSDYYSLVVPWYFTPAIPDVSGLHGYSYSLNAWSLDPMGSTNYSKLANVSINVVPSDAATDDAETQPEIGTIVPEGTTRSYRFLLRAKNWNVVRISGGSLGLPVL